MALTSGLPTSGNKRVVLLSELDWECEVTVISRSGEWCSNLSHLRGLTQASLTLTIAWCVVRARPRTCGHSGSCLEISVVHIARWLVRVLALTTGIIAPNQVLTEDIHDPGVIIYVLRRR